MAVVHDAVVKQGTAKLLPPTTRVVNRDWHKIESTAENLLFTSHAKLVKQTPIGAIVERRGLEARLQLLDR